MNSPKTQKSKNNSKKPNRTNCRAFIRIEYGLQLRVMIKEEIKFLDFKSGR
jgi:hypothetical protein